MIPSSMMFAAHLILVIVVNARHVATTVVL
jgi:hypothetical protein